jgi:hypothetical protein
MNRSATILIYTLCALVWGGKPGGWVLRSEMKLEWVVLGRRDTAIRRKTCVRKKNRSEG